MKVSEIFFSLNGEGLLVGVPTIFVRLSGCNLRCQWCDTRYAWEKGTEKNVEDITEDVRKVDNTLCEWVFLTGGEPLLQDISHLVDALSLKYRIGIETNGSLYKDVLRRCDFISVDIKPPSSRNPTEDVDTFTKVVEAVRERGGQVKAVIADENDYLFVKTFVETHHVTAPLILQPCWGEMSYRELCRLYFKNPITIRNIRVLTQIHKIGDIK